MAFSAKEGCNSDRTLYMASYVTFVGSCVGCPRISISFAHSFILSFTHSFIHLFVLWVSRNDLRDGRTAWRSHCARDDFLCRPANHFFCGTFPFLPQFVFWFCFVPSQCLQKKCAGVCDWVFASSVSLVFFYSKLFGCRPSPKLRFVGSGLEV